MKKWEILFGQVVQESEQVFPLLYTLRGLTTPEEIDAFVSPQRQSVTSETVGINPVQLEKALVRIKQAVAQKEQIIIYGDYDVDGITASAILWETLYGMQANVMPYIPNRLEEGYGLSETGITNVLAKFPQTKLIITVDNGIVAQQAVAFANDKHLEVIITDHHVASTVLPEAYALVHTTQLCGAGIAYILAKFLSDHDDDELLALACLGTIADLVPLKEANRAIVAHGLKALQKTKRLGLLELYREAGCDDIDVYTVGHVIAPRLNATGRMTSAMDSLRLLCTKDRNRAEELAGLLGNVNRERQQVMAEATKHASLSVKTREALKKLLVVSHKEYPEGVIGLVAGRLVEEYYRPAIVISRGEKVSKGSVRSVNGFNIIEFLRQFSDDFLSLGGHPMAAGFTVATENVEKLQEKLESLAHTVVADDMLLRSIKIDCVIPFSFVTQDFYDQLQLLAPFGMGNPEPTFATHDVTVSDMKILGKDGKHLKFIFTQNNKQFEAIAFGMGERASEFSIGDIISVAYTLDQNQWNGRKKLQLKVKDIKKTSGAQ